MKQKILVLLAAVMLLAATLSITAFATDTTCATDDWSYPTADFTPTWTGNGTATDPYLISTAQQLADLAYMVNNYTNEDNPKNSWCVYADTYFNLANDIDLNPGFTASNDGMTGEGTPKEWTPIGFKKENGRTLDFEPGPNNYYSSSRGFCGTFDGDGHTIKGLYIGESANECDGVGLFGSSVDYTYEKVGGTIKNLKMENCYIDVPSSDSDVWCNCVGTVVGYGGDGDIINCDVTDTYLKLSGKQGINYISGVAGLVEALNNNVANITKCTFDGKITVNGTVGEVNCGGIAGRVSSYIYITECTNYGDASSNVSGTSYIGGIVGYRFNNTNSSKGTNTDDIGIANCVNYGDITNSVSQGAIGGIAGNIYRVNSTAIPSDVKNCKNFGMLTVAAGQNGGIVGSNNSSSVRDCYNYGAIDGYGINGGIVGYCMAMNDDINIDNCYFLQSDTLNQGIFGVCGANYGNEEYKCDVSTSGAYKYDTAFTYEGAQIRTEGKQGLRFLFSISEAYYQNTLTQPTSSTDFGEGFGTVAITEQLLDKCMIFKTTTDAAVVPAVKLYARENGKVYFTVCVTDIDQSNYKTKIVVAPYATVQGNTTYGMPTDGFSVYDIAKKICEDENTSEDLKNYLKTNILDKAE